jgi:hypothetical protein
MLVSRIALGQNNTYQNNIDANDTE